MGGIANNIDRSIISDRSGSDSAAHASIQELILPELKEPPKVGNFAKFPSNIYAKYYLLMDPTSDTVFVSNDADTQTAIASTTKIMTATIVLENYKLDEVVTISREAAIQVGMDPTTKSGEKITVENLLDVLLIISSNRAAYALAEHINSPSETGTDKFVRMMNDKAKSLGMYDTDYHDAAGLDTTGYSTAHDLAIITEYAMQKPLFAKIVGTAESSVTDVTGKITHQLKNSNRLVSDWNYPGALGVKTGYMPEASHSLVAAAERDNHTLYAIILYTTYDTPEASATEARKLLDWGWANVDWGTN
ncbi:MAG: serine hydrolase [Patescibacteria group bacterium]